MLRVQSKLTEKGAHVLERHAVSTGCRLCGEAADVAGIMSLLDCS